MELADIIRRNDVTPNDKTRLLECLKRVRMHYTMHGSEPVWGNCDVGREIYKVHPNSTVTFVQSFDPNLYKKIMLKA